MSGKKMVALISDAASTGISLHAVATAGNRCGRGDGVMLWWLLFVVCVAVLAGEAARDSLEAR